MSLSLAGGDILIIFTRMSQSPQELPDQSPGKCWSFYSDTVISLRKNSGAPSCLLKPPHGSEKEDASDPTLWIQSPAATEVLIWPREGACEFAILPGSGHTGKLNL